MEYNMSHENHNNLQPWKNKLGELKKLPEPSFDKDAAWGKLYERLNEKEPGKKPGWYWIAAACLVFVLVVSMFFINNTPDKITASETKPASAETVNTVAKTKEKKDETKRADAIISGKIAITVDKKADRKTSKIVPVKPFLKLRLSDTVSEQKPALKTVDDFINPVKASPVLAITKPEKKKLRVVHVNELGDPVEAIYRYRTQRFYSLFSDKICQPGGLYKSSCMEMKKRLLS